MGKIHQHKSRSENKSDSSLKANTKNPQIKSFSPPRQGINFVAQKKNNTNDEVAQLKSSVSVNDNPALEKEADLMGVKAAQYTGKKTEVVPAVIQEKSNDTYQLMEVVGKKDYSSEVSKPGKTTGWYQLDVHGKLHEKWSLAYMPAMEWVQVGTCHGLKVYQSARDLGLSKKNQVVSAVSGGVEAAKEGLTKAQEEALSIPSVSAAASVAQGMIHSGQSAISAEYRRLEDAVDHKRSEGYGAVSSRVLATVEHIEARTLSFSQAVWDFSKQSKVKALLAFAGSIGFGYLGKWLSTLTFFAPWLGVATFGLSAIYNLMLMRHWYKEETIPHLARLTLILINGGILSSSIIDLLWAWRNGEAFSHAIFAVLPGALFIEGIIAWLIKGASKLQKEYAERNAPQENASQSSAPNSHASSGLESVALDIPKDRK